ncbi:hypothetical protein ACWEKM_03135 [Streptomyces sp. NPDC004752]
MADEQDKWLNRETAERLLRGEPLEAVDASARGRAERLAGTLGALAVEATPAGVELPGEEGALAAFRKAREATAEQAAVAHGDGSQERRTGAASRPSDVGLVRLGGRPAPARGRPRWARPVRLALAAALAVGTVGGVAVAAGTGVLPVPFGGDDPGPAASVSAAGTPEGPLVSPSADVAQGGTSGPPTPSAPTSGTPSTGSPREGSGTDRAEGGATGSAGHTPQPWAGAPAACRDLRDGKEIGPGRERLLERAAGGPARVWTYCKGVLESTGGTQGGTGRKSDGGKDGKDEQSGQDEQDDKGDRGDQGNNGDRGDQGDQGGSGDHGGSGHHGHRDNRGGHGHRGDQSGDDDGGGSDEGRGDDHRQDGGSTPVPSAFAPQRPDGPTRSPGSSPSPTYTAL